MTDAARAAVLLSFVISLNFLAHLLSKFPALFSGCISGHNLFGLLHCLALFNFLVNRFGRIEPEHFCKPGADLFSELGESLQRSEARGSQGPRFTQRTH